MSIGPSTALGDHCGWKAGGTNAAAQKTLGLEGPFRGPLFASGHAYMHSHRSLLPSDVTHKMRLVAA